MNYTNLDDLRKEIEKRISAALDDEVATVVAKELGDSAKEKVYDSYEPVWYKRRWSLYEWLVDTSGLTVAVTSESRGKAFPAMKTAAIVEAGAHNPFNNNDYPWMHPRPFIQPAVEELKKSHAHVLALQTGLKNRGVTVVHK